VECCGSKMIFVRKGNTGPYGLALLRCRVCEGHEWFGYPLRHPRFMPSGGAFFASMNARYVKLQCDVARRAYTASSAP